MSILSSKLFAINVVDVSDGNLMEMSSRLQLLESQVGSLLQQGPKQLTATNSQIPTLRSVAPPPPAPPSESSATMSSVRTGDLPASYLTAGTSVSSSPRIKPSQAKPVRSRQLPQLEQDHDVTTRIMSIIQSYGQNEENEDGDAWLGRFRFEPRVRKAVDAGVPVPLVLPAFPWKSVNKPEKVLGAVPDLGEVLGLGRLNNLCEDIEEIYPPGARVTITSDGLVYNDLLGISDEEVYHYGAALRKIPGECGYKNIDFIRIMNLLGLTDQAYMSKEDYLGCVGHTRDLLVERYLDPTFIAAEAIEEDRDIKLTYCGYLKFLAKDLRHSSVTAGITGKNEYKRVVKRVAQDMITRGKAFAAAIETVLPDHVRLSIHRSTGLNKLSFPLVPAPNHFSMTPWHCCIAVTAKGEFRTAHKSALEETHDLVCLPDGRPYYFRERSPTFDWEGVDFEIKYPKTLVVKVKTLTEGAAPRLGEKEIRKLTELGKGFNPVIAVGFAE